MPVAPRGGERISTLGEDLHHVVGQVAASQIQTEDGVGEGISFVDGTVWETPSPESITIPVVRPEAYREGTAWIATYMAGVEGLEYDLGHLLKVGLGVESLGQQNGVLLRGHAELVVEGVVPDLLHIIPVGDDTVLDGVLQSEDTTLGLGFIHQLYNR